MTTLSSASARPNATWHCLTLTPASSLATRTRWSLSCSVAKPLTCTTWLRLELRVSEPQRGPTSWSLVARMHFHPAFHQRVTFGRSEFCCYAFWLERKGRLRKGRQVIDRSPAVLLPCTLPPIYPSNNCVSRLPVLPLSPLFLQIGMLLLHYHQLKAMKEGNVTCQRRQYNVLQVPKSKMDEILKVG